MLVLSALFALGVGLAGAPAASAGTIGSGINNAAKASTLLEETAYACRRVRVCRRGAYGAVRCHWNRVCRRW
jgi:hypothetical protein